MSKSLQEQIANLQRAITAQESLRGKVDDAAIDTTLMVLRAKLTELEHRQKALQQRKQVTVLFADVSGFTAMSETKDAEEVTDLMNMLWSELDYTIQAFGGSIDKHIGDAVMAVWGVNEVREDDPERAIRAALTMQEQLAAFRGDQGIDLAMRIGINTGPALLGTVGTIGEFSAIGDTVNLANRLEQAAPVNGILVSHNAYRHVRGMFDVVGREPLTIKGKAEPILTYIVERAKPRGFRVATRGVQGIETRTIGRDAELQMLQDMFASVMDNSSTRLVTIVGEAGVGKSRLLYEFDNWVERLAVQVYVLKGRAMPTTAGVPFSIMRDLFSFRFDIRESDSGPIALEKFRAGTRGYLDASQADLAGHLVGFDFSTSPAVQNLLESLSFRQLATAYLTNFLRAVVLEMHMLILLEDLLWADESSITLLAHLLRVIPGAQLLVVCLARPELYEHWPDWGSGDACVRLDLRPLTKQASQALVSEILQKAEHVPSDLFAFVVDSAEGNPFYVEELIKMLIEDGIVVCYEDAWHIELGRLTGRRVPPTLIEVLQARLDRLSRDEREALQRASVVGRLFWDAAVASVQAESDRYIDIEHELSALHARELVLRQDRSAFSGATEYIFKHTILRDVTYETVLLKLRRIYHVQVAQWLETHAGDRIGEYLTLIAGHYELAGEAAIAADYLSRSADGLRQVSAFPEAITALERALALLPEDDLAKRAEIQVELGRNYERQSDYPAAKHYLEQGLTLARNDDNQQTVASALNSLSRVAWQQGEYDDAETLARDALAISREITDRQGVATALDNLSRIRRLRGDFEDARRYAEESLDIYRAINSQLGIAASLGTLAGIDWMRGELDSAQQSIQQSLIIYRAIGDRLGTATSLGNLGNIAMAQRQYRDAQQYVEESLKLFREIGDTGGAAQGLGNLGEIYRYQARYAEARQYLEEGVALMKELGRRLAVAHFMTSLGRVVMAQNHLDLAWQYCCEALSEAHAINAVPFSLAAIAVAAEVQVGFGYRRRGAEWLGLVRSHPATKQGTKDDMAPALQTLTGVLPNDQLEAYLRQGEMLDIDEIVTHILGNCSGCARLT